MKKTLLLLLVLVVTTAMYSQDLGFAVNLGVLTDKDFNFSPTWLSGGIEVDYHIGNFVMISPEAAFYTNSRFQSGYMLIVPSILLNFKAGPFLFGAGILKQISLRSGGSWIPLDMKIAAGLRAHKLRIGAYLMTPFNDLFGTMSIGFTLGFEF